ncbi:MAG: vWA domain-containing protein [Aequorivita sp.]
MKNKKTLYHFVLDKSGSMFNCRETTILGFNKQLETIQQLQKEFPDQEFKVSLTTFDDNVENIFNQTELGSFEKLSPQMYIPNGCTALLDAIGISINQIRTASESEILNDEMSVVMIILTDGMENASREFNYHQIAGMIKNLEQTEKWTFTFLGADIDALHTSKMLNIRAENVMSFNKEDMGTVMNEISDGMYAYSKSKFMGETKTDFLDFIVKKDRRN